MLAIDVFSPGLTVQTVRERVANRVHSTANPVTSLQDQTRPAVIGQLERGRKAGETSANDDGVVRSSWAHD
jgi:hypothetical protein